MPPLKVLDIDSFGGVDSRTNGVNTRPDRFLRLRNISPKVDGHMQLRDGYTPVPITPKAGLPTANITNVKTVLLTGALAGIVEVTLTVDSIAGFVTGQSVGIKNLVTATWLNGVTLPSITISGSTIVGRFASTHANYGPAADTGQVVSVSPLSATPLHSIVGYFSTDDSSEKVLFWQGTVCYVYDLATSTVTNPTLKGSAIESSNRWQYALGADGYLYMHNGVDSKFFDGRVLRDIGLPTLSDAQVFGISVTSSGEAPSPSTVSAVTLSWVSGTNNSWAGLKSGFWYYAYFDPTTNLFLPCPAMMNGGVELDAPTISNQQVHFSGLPTSPDPNMVGLLSYRLDGQAHPKLFANYAAGGTHVATLSGSGTTVTGVESSAHGLSVGDIVALSMSPFDTRTPSWSSNGPFKVTTVSDAFHFTFETPEAPLYSTFQVYEQSLAVVPSGATTYTTPHVAVPVTGQGVDQNTSGQFLLPYSDSDSTTLLPASTVGGAQPGYQFFASIYNPTTGHVGNRIPIGKRLANAGPCAVDISGLPDLTTLGPFLEQIGDEWTIIVGRTGDGGEVPYAIMDADGNWIHTNPGDTSITITSGQIDGAAELPTENDPPPPFACFWREESRLCGAMADSRFVYRSAAQADATKGYFMGSPEQSWPARRIETFPTAERIVAGHGYQSQSFVWTRNDLAVLSELQGQTAWNGPWNTGGAGPFAFSEGWASLPYWVSHDRQLCIFDNSNQSPIPISGEYEASLLARIGKAYLGETETVYLRDVERQLDVLRIKARDASGTAFTIIHDFNLRDGASPYGGAYDEYFQGPLTSNFTSARIRDVDGHARIWCGASNGTMQQLYTGWNDAGSEFVSDMIQLFYISPNRVAIKFLEWYGDENLEVYVGPRLDTGTSDPQPILNPPITMQRLDQDKYLVPAEEHDYHWQVDFDSPEMVHTYLWLRLASHSADAPATLLNDPPHMPLETYGKILLTAPVVGTARGR